MLRLAVLVSGGGTNLQAIIDAKRAGKIPSAELALVVASNASAYALTPAETAPTSKHWLRLVPMGALRPASPSWSATSRGLS